MTEFICRTGTIRISLRAILFGAFAQPELANMYTIACVPPEQNHPNISCSEVRAVRRCRTRFVLCRSGMSTELLDLPRCLSACSKRPRVRRHHLAAREKSFLCLARSSARCYHKISGGRATHGVRRTRRREDEMTENRVETAERERKVWELFKTRLVKDAR